MKAKPKLLITPPNYPIEELKILKEFFDVELNEGNTWFDKRYLSAHIADVDGVIAGLDPFDSDVLSRANKLKIIARRGLGVDNIDLQYARSMGILVTITPVEEEIQSVAEFTITLVSSLLKNLKQADHSLSSGLWERKSFIGKMFSEVTLGICGLGRIGSRVAQIATNLGMHVVYYDIEPIRSSYTPVSKEDLFSIADVITLHLPLIDRTRNFVSAEYIRMMKRGAMLVNTSRSELVDQKELLHALKEDRIASAAVDVFTKEPPEGDPLLKLPNLVGTPHIAAFTWSALKKMDQICVSNVIDFLIRGKRPKHVVESPLC